LGFKVIRCRTAILGEETELRVGIEDKVVEGSTTVTRHQFPVQGLPCLSVEGEVVVANADRGSSVSGIVGELSAQSKRSCLIIIVLRR